jgi:hypothetical protein
MIEPKDDESLEVEFVPFDDRQVLLGGRTVGATEGCSYIIFQSKSTGKKYVFTKWYASGNILNGADEVGRSVEQLKEEIDGVLIEECSPEKPGVPVAIQHIYPPAGMTTAEMTEWGKKVVLSGSPVELTGPADGVKRFQAYLEDGWQ